MVAVTAAMGYFLASGSFAPFDRFIVLLLGTFLSGAGASALNAYLEREVDQKMERTKNRASAQGTLTPTAIILYGTISTVAGSVLLASYVNLLTGFLALLTAFLYVLVYTPLKRITWLNTSVGAIPGALPPLGGWAAATGNLELPAWILFAILFLWQHPHFYAIAWIYRDDYRRGGFQMLPVVDTDGRRTFRQVLFYSSLLIPVSLLPFTLGVAGSIYLYGALLAGGAFLAASAFFVISQTTKEARNLLFASLVYLPFLLLLVVADSQFAFAG